MGLKQNFTVIKEIPNQVRDDVIIKMGVKQKRPEPLDSSLSFVAPREQISNLLLADLAAIEFFKKMAW